MPAVRAGGDGGTESEVVAVMRDVTDRKIQEQALDLARSAAEQADASKSRFLATMSHELRTPLNAIIGFSEMIVQEDVLMVDAARRKEYAQLINDSGQHLLSVVNGILDMSKMESGNFEISPEPFAPRAALLNCCNLLALKARENGIDLVTRAPDDLPVMTGDPRAFKQIVLNLVSNAIKFTERGGTVTVSAGVEGARLVLRVTDTGVGIAADDLKRIGDPFFQAGKTYQRRHEGTGLGLSIVKSLVALHSGEMSVQSKIDEGTTVTVALPLAFTPKAEQPSSNIATLTPALRLPAQNQAQSGEEKCLDRLQVMTTCRAAAVAPMRLRSSRSERGFAMRVLLHSPKDMIAGVLAFAAVSAIVANALLLQEGHHPAPMFGSTVALPAPASPLPRPRPSEAAIRPADAAPAEPKPVELKAADPLANLVKATATSPIVSAPVASAPVARPPAAIPAPAASIAGSRRVAAVQRTLTEYGYGQLKPTGTVGCRHPGRDPEIRARPQDAGDRPDVRSSGARIGRDGRSSDRLAKAGTDFGSIPTSGHRRKIQHRRLLGRVFARPCIPVKLLERRARLVSRQNKIGIEKGADRIAAEILGRAHPFRRDVPVGEIVDLQFDQVLIRIGVVERCGQSMVQANLGFDASVFQAGIG